MKIKIIILQIFLLLTSILFLNPHWMTNDDPGMMMIASGQYSGIPDPHIIFSNIIIGKLLSYLFTLNSQINWYSILHYAILYISLVTISFYSLLKSKNNSLFIFIILVILSILTYTNLQFTITSTISITAALIIFSNDEEKSIQSILVIFFTLIAILIRWQLIFLFIPFVCFIFIINKYKCQKLYPIFIATLLSVVLFAFDIYFYNTDLKWKSFKQYDSIRGQIHGTAKLSDYQSTWINGYQTVKNDVDTINKLKSIRWTVNDANLFINWSFIANDKYSHENITYINEKFKSKKNIINIYYSLIENIISNVEIFILLIIVMCLLFFDNKKAFFYIVGLVIILLISITTIQRMPSHLFISILLLSVITTITFVKQYKNIYLFPLFLVLILTIYFRIIENHNIQNGRSLISQINKSLTKPINIALVAGKSYPYKYMSLFTNDNMNAKFFGLGWMNASPLNISLMKINKITDYKDLIDRKDVVLVTSLPVLKMIITYLNENNHLTCKAIVKNEILSSSSEYENVYIWQIISEHQQ